MSLGKGFLARGALVDFIDCFIIDEIIRKIDPMETKGKTVDQREVLIVATVTHEVFLNIIHPHILLKIFPSVPIGKENSPLP